MALRGDLTSIKRLKSALRAYPLSLAHEVASRGAPEMTRLTRSAFDSAQNVYGDPRPTSTANGDRLTLYRTGAVSGALRFVSNGTVLRCVIGPKYAKYLIGKYGILPIGALPASWTKRLGEIVAEAKGPAV